MRVIEVIPYRTFKEKLQIVKDYEGKGKIEILRNIVYIERVRGISMAEKELLKQYNSLLEEIKELRTDIERLEKKEIKYEIDKVKGSNSEFPYQPRSFTIEGYNIIEEEQHLKRILTKKNILARRKSKCEDIKLDIEEFIDTIPDSLTRRVFRYRYIDNLSWTVIAMRMNKVHESYPRKIHDRYLEGLK